MAGSAVYARTCDSDIYRGAWPRGGPVSTSGWSRTQSSRDRCTTCAGALANRLRTRRIRLCWRVPARKSPVAPRSLERAFYLLAWMSLAILASEPNAPLSETASSASALRLSLTPDFLRPFMKTE